MIVGGKMWERPTQLVCPLEIRSTMTTVELNKRMAIANKEYPESEVPRPRRLAKMGACKKISRIAEDKERY